MENTSTTKKALIKRILEQRERPVMVGNAHPTECGADTCDPLQNFLLDIAETIKASGQATGQK